MTTTLKLDWPPARTRAVLAVIERPDTTLTNQQQAALWNDLASYRDVDATIKVDWPVSWIDALVADLETYTQGSLRDSAELIAAVTDIRGYRETVVAIAEGFTAADALAWLGISPETYGEAARILRGRHGNPIDAALLDARQARHDGTAAAQVLARHGIDPADPLAAVRAFDQHRAQFD